MDGIITNIQKFFSTYFEQFLIAIIAGLVLYILLFPVRQSITQRAEKKKEEEKKLRIHFEDINREIISHISEMARSLAIRGDSYLSPRREFAPEKKCGGDNMLSPPF